MITAQQKSSAQQSQLIAAQDSAQQVRLVAGPGTGKSHTIEQRVAHLLSNNVNPRNIYVISFTRATCSELEERIVSFCRNTPYAQDSTRVRVSTMHALALRILQRAHLLSSYPSMPNIIDDWEHKYIYDEELANYIGCTTTRAAQIRLAYETQWQTLNLQYINQAQITHSEIQSFNTFHNSRTNFYCCVLPGEVIFKCVDALQQGALQSAQLPTIEHLIVDEFQDLNRCDQQFIQLLSQNNTILFVSGDDDQSIYSFRHANPEGIVDFHTTYPNSSTHVLNDCFRCAPEILSAASRLIANNPNRVSKSLVSLYASATPPVNGHMKVWSFQNAQEEANAIAESCQQLINEGMSGREDEILILINNRRVQLDMISQALANLGLPYDTPSGSTLVNEYEVIRAVYTLLRILKDLTSGRKDYMAFRDILELLSGVGISTAVNITQGCITNNQNFRELFDLGACPSWLTGRNSSAVQRIMDVVQAVSNWDMNDTLIIRDQDFRSILSTLIFTSATSLPSNINIWDGFVGELPPDMTLDELLQYLVAERESEQQAIINAVEQRTGISNTPTQIPNNKRIRILTMHGAKGLSGKVVFIPGADAGIIPSFRALNATGLLIEQRRLFYVSLTRAMACCIVTHCSVRSGMQAMALRQRPQIRLTRSQFLNEMVVSSQVRNSGLSQTEATNIVIDINNL